MTLITYHNAMAVSQDAGNRSMRKAGRTVWNADDQLAALDEFERLYGPQMRSCA